MHTCRFFFTLLLVYVRMYVRVEGSWVGKGATFDDATKMRSDIDEYIEDSVMRILYSV